MNTYLKATVEALLDRDEVAASSHLKEYFEQKKAAILREDHEKFMTSDEMEQHILKLHNKAPDKKEFLNKLATFSDLDTCTEKDLKTCANNIQSKGKKFMDTAIHSLEKLIGYKFDPKTVLENLFGNMIARSVPGVPNNNEPIPNAFTNKKINKKRQKLPTLKKSVYGTGNPPINASGAPVASGGEGAVGGE